MARYASIFGTEKTGNGSTKSCLKGLIKRTGRWRKNLSQPEAKKVEGLDSLPKERSFGIDTAAINQRYANDDGRRRLKGMFRIPVGAGGRIAEELARKAGEAWLKHLDSTGWKRLSNISVRKRGISVDPKTLHLVDEFVFEGEFGKEPRPVRVEIPPGIVQRDPQQIVTLREATKALGLVRRPKVRTARLKI